MRPALWTMVTWRSTPSWVAAGQQDAHAEGHPLAVDALDRLDDVAWWPTIRSTLGSASSLRARVRCVGVGVERYSCPQCRNTTVNWEPARLAALASARIRPGESRLTSHG